MTIKEIMSLCIKPRYCKVKVYDLTEFKTVWDGYGDEIPEEYANKKVRTFDIPTEECMTFNVFA